jgi:hypothetical protein
MSILFVKGISSELLDNEIRNMLTNHCSFGTIDKVIIKRPKHLSSVSGTNQSIYFINAIVYFKHISLERFGQRNIDNLNQGGFIKIIYCQSTPSAPARYWKAFKYDGDQLLRLPTGTTEFSRSPATCFAAASARSKSRIISTNNNNNNRLDINNGHHNGAVAPGPRETVSKGLNVTMQRDLRCREVAKPEYVPIVDKLYVNLLNTVVSRKYPAPTIQNTQNDTDDEDELRN